MNQTDPRPVARFSPDRRYRYLLTRQVGFGDRGTVTFIMLNPSTADETHNDPTIRRCIGFANSWSYGWLHVVNLSPLRATDPKELIDAGPEPEDVWEENILTVRETALASDLIIAAWGAHGAADGRAPKVIDALARSSGFVGHEGIHCLGVTKTGQPRHPLYIKGDTQPLLYRNGGEAL